jgi:hypothetical protein
VKKRPVGSTGYIPLPKRWVVERTNAWNGRARRTSKDYERRPEFSAARIHLSNPQFMLRRLSPELRQRPVIETVNDQLKTMCPLEPTCHRSLTNCVVNVITALIAYTSQEKNPSVRFTDKEFATLPALVF